jgi:hypothetical protein
LERSDVSEMQLLHSLFQQIRFLRSRVWDVLICPKFSFFPLSSNGSDSWDQEFEMSDLSEMQVLHSLFQQIWFLRSRAWNAWSVRNAVSLSSNRSDSCDQEFGMFWSVRNSADLAIKSLECSDQSETQLLYSLLQQVKFLRSRAWNVRSVRNAASIAIWATYLAQSFFKICLH